MVGNLGMGEILILMAIALIVIGPEKFPQFAKIVIRTFRDLRNYVDDVKHELSKELRPIDRELRQLSHVDPENLIDALTGETEENSSEPETPPAPHGEEVGEENPNLPESEKNAESPSNSISPDPPSNEPVSQYESYFND